MSAQVLINCRVCTVVVSVNIVDRIEEESKDRRREMAKSD